MAGGNFDPYTHQNNDLSTSAGVRKFHRSASPSTDDARYVAGNRARQEAARARNASNPSFSGLLNSILGKDPRARDRSTFRNPQANQPGVFGYEGFLRPATGNFLTDAMRFGPLSLLAGAINAATTGPRDTGTEYTMNTQSGVGPGTYQPKAPAPQQQPQYGAQAPSVQTSPLLGYGFEEDKFGFDPRAPRATLDDLDIDLNPGYSQMANGQYVPSYNPFEASTAAQAQLTPDAADLELSQWLQTEQGSRYNNPDLPENFVRRMFEASKRLNAGKF